MKSVQDSLHNIRYWLYMIENLTSRGWSDSKTDAHVNNNANMNTTSRVNLQSRKLKVNEDDIS